MNQPITYFAEISRVDEEKRIVEGFCYVNARVKSDPWDLPIDVLRSASEDYMRWANVREMHDNKAVGTALDLEFQDNDRVFIRTEIVDDPAWEKVKKGVYKGFSIKGRPEVVRGQQVQKFTWLETSLVDRPADPEAVITLWRRDDTPKESEVEAPAKTFGCDLGHEHATAQESADCIRLSRADDDRLHGQQHYDCGSKTCHGHKQQAAAKRCADGQMERAEIHIPDDSTDEEIVEIQRAWDAAADALTRSEEPAPDTDPTPAAPAAAPDPGAEPEDPEMATVAELTERMDTLTATMEQIITRLDAAAGEEPLQRLETATAKLNETNEKLERVESELETAKAEIKRIGDQPAGPTPVRFPGALTRECVQRFGEANIGADNVKKLQRYEELQTIAPPDDPKEREKLAEEVMTLRRELKGAALI